VYVLVGGLLCLYYMSHLGKVVLVEGNFLRNNMFKKLKLGL